MGDARYFITFIDDFLKMMYLYALKSKRECFEKLKEFKIFVKIQPKHKIKAIWLDNGMKYISKAFWAVFFENYDIEKQTSTPYRP